MDHHQDDKVGMAYGGPQDGHDHDYEPKHSFDRSISPSVGEVNLSSNNQLERGLKSRHIQFLALGGAIGTGLFIGSGQILATVGPAPLFMAYLVMMLVVWVVMNDLAEMVTYLPMKGISIPYFVGRFVEPSLAFATGWNYWYAYAILIAAECTAGAIVISYWTETVPVAVWIAIQLVVILFLNIVAVSWFGEAEFWFASVKLITILGLIIVGIVLFFGGGPNHDPLYFKNWQDPPKGPGAFVPYITGGNFGRFLAFWTALARAGFSFITSPELIALSAGETVAPRRNIPKAARRFVWRLAGFYGLGSLVIGILVSNTNPKLLSGNSNASASPFVIGIQNAGIPVLNHLINAAILTSAWSAGNAFCFSGSRVLYSMALNGQAPRWFAKTSNRGVPYVAVLFTLAIGLLAFLNVSSGGAMVFAWFSNISTISGYIAWIVVMITYLRFRKAMKFNNMLDVLPFRTPLQPYATWFTLFFITLLTLTNGFQVFVPKNWSVSSFLAAYITIPIFLALYLGHKIWFRTPFAIKTEDVDVITGKREMDELEAMDRPPIPRNFAEKIWFWLA
ncbi:amino acid permease [Astrocystis sublimbata]|nr:amino acid permease [Astrocystis sublimbata]